MRAGVIIAVAAVGALVAGPASAHVVVQPTEASQGGYVTLTFLVPNETDSADTVKVEVNLPTDTPIASVATKPLAGWTVETQTSKLLKPVKTDDGEVTDAISKITWTAGAGSGIKPGQFQEFEISAGPMPETNQVIFKTLQTYSDG